MKKTHYAILHLSATRSSFRSKGFQKTHLWPLKKHFFVLAKMANDQPYLLPSIKSITCTYRRHILWTRSTSRMDFGRKSNSITLKILSLSGTEAMNAFPFIMTNYYIRTSQKSQLTKYFATQELHSCSNKTYNSKRKKK